MDRPLIYIIDNDLISIFDIKIRLHQSSFPSITKCFQDTDSAFAMLSSDYRHIDGIPDIMLVSFDLPGMDGLKFLERLKVNGIILNRTHIYLFSSYGVPHHIKNSDWDRQIKGYFIKPLNGADMSRIFAELGAKGDMESSRAM